MNNKLLMLAVMVMMLVMIAGCAPGEVTQVEIPSVSLQLSVPGPNPLLNTADANNHVSSILISSATCVQPRSSSR